MKHIKDNHVDSDTYAFNAETEQNIDTTSDRTFQQYEKIPNIKNKSIDLSNGYTKKWSIKKLINPLLLGITIVGISGLIAYTYSDSILERQFESEANLKIQEVKSEVEKYNNLLTSLSALIEKENQLDQSVFFSYAQNLLSLQDYDALRSIEILSSESPENTPLFYKDLTENYKKFFEGNTLSSDIQRKVLTAIEHNKIMQSKKAFINNSNGNDKLLLMKYAYPINPKISNIGEEVFYIKNKDLEKFTNKEVFGNITFKYRDLNEKNFNTYIIKKLKTPTMSGVITIGLKLDGSLFGYETSTIRMSVMSPASDGKREIYNSFDDVMERKGGYSKTTFIKIGAEEYEIIVNSYKKAYETDAFMYIWKLLIIFSLFIFVFLFLLFTKKLNKTKALIEDDTRLQHLSLELRLDELTHLLNRRAFVSDIDYLLNKSKKVSSAYSIDVIFIDLDGFKRINDTLGHSYGDYVLKSYANRLRDLLDDVESATIYRLGGDEFTVILNNQEDDEVKLVVRNILEISKEPFHLKEEDFYITQSIGVSTYPDNSWTSETLLKNADMAMYEAKKMGKNCCVFFNSKISEEIDKKNKIVNNLAGALERDEFSMVYQPKFKMIKKGLYKFYGIESLIRWENEKLGGVAPGVFIPLAEESGMIKDIGSWVLEKICSDYKLLEAAGLKDFKMAVNISARQLANENLPHECNKVLKKYGINPNFIIIEITETTMMKQTEITKKSLAKFEEYGFTISVDDFGTGYSSLSYLRQFPIHELKIDKSFTDLMLHDHHTKVIVEGIVQMSQKLDISIIIEGVETYEQLIWLEENLVTNSYPIEIQGYYFSKPLNKQDLLSFLSQNNVIDIEIKEAYLKDQQLGIQTNLNNE